MKTGLIYRAISPSGKNYIGRTIDFEDRKRCHIKNSFDLKCKEYNLAFHCAIRKYGFENIKWEILMDDIPDIFLNDMEIEYIKEFDSFKNGYNETIGGDGFCGENHPCFGKVGPNKNKKFTNSHKLKISQTRITEKIAKGENNPMYGRKGQQSPHYGKCLSEEHKLKISSANKGRKRPDVSKRFKGRIISEKHRQAIIESNKKRSLSSKRNKKGQFLSNE